jgi:hypothetical protein
MRYSCGDSTSERVTAESTLVALFPLPSYRGMRVTDERLLRLVRTVRSTQLSCCGRPRI